MSGRERVLWKYDMLRYVRLIDAGIECSKLLCIVILLSILTTPYFPLPLLSDPK